MENTLSPSPGQRQFVVVMRGPSAAIFRQGENLKVNAFPSAVGSVDITYTTRWLKRGQGIMVPGHLWIEVTGQADSLEAALGPFANAGLAMLPILALGTNAAVGEPAIEVGFENTPCVIERDYFQSYVPPETDIVYITRHVNVEATVALIRALSTNSDSERLRRGANQYQLALSYWRLGLEALALAHLWMVLEAITKALLREECSKRDLNAPGQLAESLGVPLEQLDGVVRKDLILKGDEECYKKASEASNALEHGYLDYREIIDLSKDVRHRMAKYVRTAILGMCVLDKGIYNILVNKPFDTPLGHWPIAKYLRGKLVGAGETLAKEGKAYPFLRWKPIIKSTKFDSDGKLNIQFTESLTPELAKGISFQPKSLEAWRAE